MEPIDFKRLLREERNRSRHQHRLDTRCDGGATVSDHPLTEPSVTISSSSSSLADDRRDGRSGDMEGGIALSSFPHVSHSNQLGGDRVEMMANELNLPPSSTGPQLSNYPAWPHPPGFLSLSNLALTLICDDPMSISYSRTALSQGDGKRDDSDDHPSDHGGGGTVPEDPASALEGWLKRLPSGESGLGEWKTMSYGKRRVCMFGEEDGNGVGECDGGGIGGTLPAPLREIAEQLVARGVFPPSAPPNHVLLNEYYPGQWILPHTDGPLYDCRTATLSLSSSVVIEFTKRLNSSEIGNGNIMAVTTTPPSSTLERSSTDASTNNSNAAAAPFSEPTSPLQVLLEHGSLLVFEGAAYRDYCHGIAMGVCHDETTDRCLNAPPRQVVPRGKRYSLTFRHKKGTTAT